MLSMKKSIGWLLVLVLLVQLLPGTVLTARAAETTAVTVAEAEAAPGDTVSLAVSIAYNTGFAGFTLRPSYDKQALTLKEVTQGDVLNATDASGLSTNVDVGVMNWATAENTQGDGTLMYLTFTVNADAAVGSYPVTLQVEDFFSVDDEGRFLDCTVEMLSGGVTVSAQEHTHQYAAVISDPTCTENGYTTYTCACGDSYISDPTNSLGHDYANGVCTRCGKTEATVLDNGWSGDTDWTLTEDGVLTFSGKGAMKNYTYKSEMPWYQYADQITSVVIEDGVTRIGSYAFYGMSKLERIRIAESVTAIGDYAFKNCSKLDKVVLPSKLTALGESAFYACSELTAIDVPASLYTVKPYTFKNCTSLASVTFHEGSLQKISDGAFYNTALTEVVLPDCLDILDVYVFKNCSRLASVKLGNGLTQIREAVLYGTAISTIQIPEGVGVIKPYAFKNCTKLVSVELPSTLTTVDEAAFYACTALESVELPDAVTSIGNYAFRKCTGLSEFGFSSELLTIGESSFYGCIHLTELVIPAKVSEIKGYAFKGCTGVTSITLPESLVTIGDSAFHTCTGLKTIVIPVNVTVLGEYCFSGSYNLWQITFQGDAPSIGTGAFKSLVATACYPGDNTTWTSDVMQNYGGTIAWKAV